jgi:ribosome-associated protein
MKDFTTELTYKTSRSSGAGGQNVNKVETSVTVLWSFLDSEFFSDFQKRKIATKLNNRINAENILQVSASEYRTQLRNKKLATSKILELVDEALIIPKLRLKTKPTKGKIEKRLKSKKIISEKKANRKFRE